MQEPHQRQNALFAILINSALSCWRTIEHEDLGDCSEGMPNVQKISRVCKLSLFAMQGTEPPHRWNDWGRWDLVLLRECCGRDLVEPQSRVLIFILRSERSVRIRAIAGRPTATKIYRKPSVSGNADDIYFRIQLGRCYGTASLASNV